MLPLLLTLPERGNRFHSRSRCPRKGTTPTSRERESLPLPLPEKGNHFRFHWGKGNHFRSLPFALFILAPSCAFFARRKKMQGAVVKGAGQRRAAARAGGGHERHRAALSGGRHHVTSSYVTRQASPARLMEEKFTIKALEQTSRQSKQVLLWFYRQ